MVAGLAWMVPAITADVQQCWYEICRLKFLSITLHAEVAWRAPHFGRREGWVWPTNPRCHSLVC